MLTKEKTCRFSPGRHAGLGSIVGLGRIAAKQHGYLLVVESVEAIFLGILLMTRDALVI